MKQSKPKNQSHASMKTDLTLESEEDSNDHSFHSSKSDLIRVTESINLVAEAFIDQQNRSFPLFEYDSEEILSDRHISQCYFDPLNEPELEDLSSENFCPKVPEIRLNINAMSNIELALETSYSWETKNGQSCATEGKNDYFNESIDRPNGSSPDRLFLLELEPIIDLNDSGPECMEPMYAKEQRTCASQRMDIEDTLSHSNSQSEILMKNLLDQQSMNSRRNSIESIQSEILNFCSTQMTKYKLCKNGLESVTNFLWEDFQSSDQPGYSCSDLLCRTLLDQFIAKRQKAKPLRNEQLIKKVLNYSFKFLLKSFRHTHFKESRISSSIVKQQFVESLTSDPQSFDQLCRPGFRKTVHSSSELLTYNTTFFKRIGAYPRFVEKLLHAVNHFEALAESIFAKEMREFCNALSVWLDSNPQLDKGQAVWMFFNGKGKIKADRLVKLPWTRSQYRLASDLVRGKLLKFTASA